MADADRVNCPECGGGGTCPRCGGSGGGDSAAAQCRHCRGTGDCPACDGEGTVEVEPTAGRGQKELIEGEEP